MYSSFTNAQKYQSNKWLWGMESNSCTTCTKGNKQAPTPLPTSVNLSLTSVTRNTNACVNSSVLPVQCKKAGARRFLIGQAEGDLFSHWVWKGRLWHALIGLSWVFLPPAGYSVRVCESGGGYNSELQETGMEEAPLGWCGIFLCPAMSLIIHNRPIKQRLIWKLNRVIC